MISLLNFQVELREVVLKDKPIELLNLGGRSTVPQLVHNGVRYEESLDIIFWVIEQSKHQDNVLATQLWPNDELKQNIIKEWIKDNDNEFKGWLDKYKYADRFPEKDEIFYRERGEQFLYKLECQLSDNAFLLGNSLSLLDVAIFPFIRQFAGVNTGWFEASKYVNVRKWLSLFLESQEFQKIMQKYPKWQNDQEKTIFPKDSL